MRGYGVVTAAPSLHDLRPRLALLAFLESEGGGSPGGATIARQQITEATGIPRSTIGRYLNKLRAEGVITTRRERPGGQFGPLTIWLRSE